MRHLWIFGMAFSLCVSVAHGQEAETGAVVQQDTSTGALLQKLHSDLLKELAPYNSESSTLAIPAATQERFDTLRMRLIERLWQHRAQCRADIRRSNRDARIRTVNRCMNTDLEIQRSILKEEQSFFGQLPVLNEKLMDTYNIQTTELLDAQESIQNALEANVFGDEDTLLQALNNLAKRYRGPKKLAFLHLRADREMRWIQTIVSTWNNDSVEESTIQNRYHAFSCLWDLKQNLKDILQTKTIEKAMSLQEKANDNSTQCRILLQQSLDSNPPENTQE